MESHEKCKGIVICPADKGGGLDVLSKEYYQSEVSRLLSDGDTYKILNKAPMLPFKDKLHLIIEDGKGQRILTKQHI